MNIAIVPAAKTNANILLSLGRAQKGIPTRYSGPELIWNRVKMASKKKETAEEKENSIFVPAVPTKKGNEKTLFFITTFKTKEIRAAELKMVLVLRLISFREGDKKTASIMNGKRIIYLS